MTISTNLKPQLWDFFKKDTVLFISLILAIISSFISMPKIEYIDFKVLALLFNLMIVVAAFKKLKVLDTTATMLLKKCTSYRSISLILVLITFLSSMLVTNDVALITFVPLSIIICKKAKIHPEKIIIFQTLGANLGSSFTPMGNPQNLYIYSYFNLSALEFFKITLPLLLVSIVFLGILLIKVPKVKLEFELEKIAITNKKQVIYYSLLFIFILLSVFHLIDYRYAFLLTITIVFLLDKNLFTEVDYSLLLTFIFFFIFIGNISSLEWVKAFMSNILKNKNNTYFSSIMLSQIISNVPCTMLLASFTNNFKELLFGVNIGGMGTLIASMASLISYKLYVKEGYDNSNYVKKFSFYNLLGLLVITPIILIIFI
ncbi:MAG: anion transporter [Clostridium sp.]|nr:anion transporter [Clostridium sp.]